jgi:hypothetical protein
VVERGEIYKILSNPLYKGEIEHNRRDQDERRDLGPGRASQTSESRKYTVLRSMAVSKTFRRV